MYFIKGIIRVNCFGLGFKRLILVINHRIMDNCMVTRLIGDREKGFDSMNEIIFLRPIDDFMHLTKEIFKKGNAITGDF